MKTKIVFVLFFIVLGYSQVAAQTNYWHQTNGPDAGTLREMSIDSAGRIIVWTSGSGVYRSTDKGNSWSLLNRGLPNLNMERGACGKSGYLFGFNQYDQVFRFNENSPSASWEDITPDTNITIYDILADPNGELYVATYQKGVLRSDDNGSTWLRKNTGIRDSVSKQRFDSSSEYLSLDGNGNLFSVTTNGKVYKSSNKGDSWTELPTRNPGGRLTSDLLVTPTGNIVVGTTGTKGSPNLGGRIYISQDMGKTWDSVYERPVNTQEVKNNIDKIIRVPGSNVLYANAHGITLRSTDNGLTWKTMDSIKRGDEPFSMGALGGDLYQMSEPDGIFYSNDNGVTWTPKITGLLAELMWGIAINSKQKLFGITEYGLWRSSDNGDSWDQAPEYGETYYPSLFINKKDYLYIGTSFGLFRSKDDGNTLDHVVINLDSTLTSNIIVQVGANDKGKLFCASLVDSISFITSTDDGDHWVRVTNLPEPNTGIDAMAFATKDTILLASNVSSYYRSIDDGDTWQLLSSNNNGTAQVLINSDGSYLSLANSANGGVYRSVDEAQNWVKIFPPADFLQQFTRYYSMTIDSKDRIIVCTDSGVWRSVDNQYSEWTLISSGMTAQDFPNHYISASQVIENPVTHIFFAASRGLSVFKSVPYLDTANAGVISAIPVGSPSITAFPNPFPSTTNLSYTIEKQSDIHLDVYDLLGRHIKTLFSGIAETGEHSVTFDGSSLPDGNYAIVLRTEDESKTIWVTLVH